MRVGQKNRSRGVVVRGVVVRGCDTLSCSVVFSISLLNALWELCFFCARQRSERERERDRERERHAQTRYTNGGTDTKRNVAQLQVCDSGFCFYDNNATQNNRTAYTVLGPKLAPKQKTQMPAVASWPFSCVMVRQLWINWRRRLNTYHKYFKITVPSEDTLFGSKETKM